MRIINKVTITRGAIFDYEEIVCKTIFDACKIKEEVEKLIEKEDKAQSELRIKHTDEKSGKELIFFIRKGYKFGIMQMWIMEGICEAKDYKESMERDGTIRKWLEVEIE